MVNNMFIQIEETPNPNTLKFLPGFEILNEGETADFSNARSFEYFAENKSNVAMT